MKASVAWTVVAIVLGAACDGLAGQTEAAHVIVFDFVCKEKPEYGPRLAETVRIKLRRHLEYDVIDQWTTRDFTEPMAADADAEKIRKAMTELLGANLALCGTVHVDGQTVRAEVRCIDLTEPGKARQWTRAFADQTQRWHAVIAGGIVESVTGQPEWKPPEYGDEPTPRNFGKPVNVNGDFENGHTGWEAPDNFSTYIVKNPAGPGHVLKIRTDVGREAWLDYTRKLLFGLADPNRPPAIVPAAAGNSVGAYEGVHYRSDWIDATAGQRYWLTARARGPGGAKIFIKGYLDWTEQAAGLPESSLIQRGLTPKSFAELPEAERTRIIRADAKANPTRYRRECYRWYLNCGRGYRAAPVPPRGGLPANVRWIQIQVYAYWPAGTYYFDDVFLYKDPNQTAPLPEEPARTEGFEKGRERHKDKQDRPPAPPAGER